LIKETLMTFETRLPQARTENLLVRDLPNGELMVYDTQRDQAHTLNRSAALVWRHCDGKREAAQVAAHLHEEMGLPAEVELVWQAVARLQKAKLLQAGPGTDSVSRRALVKKLGLAAGLAALVPVVDSISAPAAATAGSGCIPDGQPTPGGCPTGLTSCCSQSCTRCTGGDQCGIVTCESNAE
jgi:hypothetical protein